MRLDGDWTLDGVTRPWGERPGLHAFLRARLDATTGRLNAPVMTLPDEPDPEHSRIRWAPGALDGVMGHHVAAGEDQALRVRQLIKALGDVCADATAEHLAHFHRLAVREPVLGIVDDVLGALHQGLAKPERVHAVGVLLAREAPEREAVKLGLALVGSVRGMDDRALLLELGAHDEFTLFAAVALANQGGDEAELALWDLAKSVDGWGRIQTVERLAGTRRPELKAWLLREGFRNSVMNEYLAWTCAMVGELHVALADPEPDAALLRGAAGLLVALASGGPARDLGDYPHAEAALEAWLSHLERRGLDLEQVEALDGVADREGLPEKIVARLDRLRHGPAVSALIDEGLASDDMVTFWRANKAARDRQRDTLPIHLARIEAGATDADTSLWFVFGDATEATIDRALAAAARRIDYARVATGPSDSLGMGPEFAPHRALDNVLPALQRFPGRGVDALVAGLASPVVRNRNFALRTLAAWGRDRWPSPLREAAERAAALEPVDELKARFARVLASGPFDEPSAG